jgi:hypothetical protein
VIEPRWWPGYNAVSADLFTVDGGGKLGPTANQAVIDQMKSVYAEHGVVHLRNSGLTTLQEMQQYTVAVQGKQPWYEGGANKRKALQPGSNVYEVGAPGKAWLHYHHEMAYNGHSVKNLGFCCRKAAKGKGATFVSEQTLVTDALLKTSLGKKLKEKGVTYVRCLTDRDYYDKVSDSNVYNHWQISFGVETPEEAERMATQCGLTTEWASDPVNPDNQRYLMTYNTISAFEYVPDLDRNILFSSLADHPMWFDQWPGVKELPNAKRPLQMTYGDGTEITDEERQEWIDVYDLGGVKIDWEVGDVVVVDNYRFAHGRPGYELEPGEERELGVTMGPKFQREGCRADRW